MPRTSAAIIAKDRIDLSMACHSKNEAGLSGRQFLRYGAKAYKTIVMSLMQELNAIGSWKISGRHLPGQVSNTMEGGRFFITWQKMSTNPTSSRLS